MTGTTPCSPDAMATRYGPEPGGAPAGFYDGKMTPEARCSRPNRRARQVFFLATVPINDPDSFHSHRFAAILGGICGNFLPKAVCLNKILS